MKNCGYCKGTGRRIQKAKNEEGTVKIWGFNLGIQCAVNERCKKCNGTGKRPNRA